MVGATRRGPVVFLDRDGVITAEVGDYIRRAEDLVLVPGSADAIARLNRAGFEVIVFTNQAGIGRGLFSLEDLAAIHQRLTTEVSAAGGTFLAIYACPHHPDEACECRKPKPGMLLTAAAEHGVDLASSWVVGDSPRDIEAGHAVGCGTVLVETGHTRAYDAATFAGPRPDAVFPGLPEAADWLIREHSAEKR